MMTMNSILMMLTMTPAEIRRRKAASAMIDMLCQTSPAQAAFRDAGRRHQELIKELFAAHVSGEDGTQISYELVACGERLVKLADLIGWQWGGLFER